MKKYICLALITAAMLGLIPYSVCKFSLAKEKQEEDTSNFYEQYDTFSSDSQITIFNHKENRTETMNFRDYIIGVVAAEVPVPRLQLLQGATFEKVQIRNLWEL